VGGVAYGNTDAFRAAVQKNWDQGITVQDGHGLQDTATGRSPASRLLRPRARHQNGDIFVSHGQCRRTGAYQGVRRETPSVSKICAPTSTAISNYNDMVVKLTDTNWLVH